MRKTIGFILTGICVAVVNAMAQDLPVKYVSSFENVNHPQVAYWFFTDKMMVKERYRSKIDSFARYSKYTLIFLTQRDGCDFYDAKTMRPVFADIVDYAHQKGLKIALQIWKDDRGTRIENTDRLIQEGEINLDNNGSGSYAVKAKGAREPELLLKSELFKVYTFKKTSDGFYDPATLKDITSSVKTTASKNEVTVEVNSGSIAKGYTAYILTQHYYASCSNFSSQAKDIILNAFKAYKDIPFDGIGLDEYKGMKIARQKVMETTNEVFRERLYTLALAAKIKTLTGADLSRMLFDMRYAPEGKEAVRVKAINAYMSVLRTMTLGVEAAMYDLGKKMYGPNAFIGLHSTFHNNLDKDEVWQTGISWWNIKRDYGHTDEMTPTPIQMGVGMSYKKNVVYNMYYGHDLDNIWTKALTDLRYGIRTHYHAANDVNGWGISIDAPEALAKINKVENAARMMNRFNPLFPKIKLLVVYGMEALCNWYPNESARGMYDINEKLGLDKKSVQLWNSGYLNVSVPTDVIEDGRLKLNAAGKPVLNGYVFDAVIFLNPQYAKPQTTRFFLEYVNRGGALLTEGEATIDFHGNSMKAAWEKIQAKSAGASFTMANIEKLPVKRNELVDGVANTDGSFTFTNVASLENGKDAVFVFTDKGNTYTGVYRGIAIIRVDGKGNLERLSATGFSSLKKNGLPVYTLDKPSDVFIDVRGGRAEITVADETRTVKVAGAGSN